MKTTTNEGFSYATDVDTSALPSEAQAFLLGQDSRFTGWDAAFGAIAKPPCFSARCSADGSPMSQNSLVALNFDVTDYNVGLNGQTAGISGTQWSQPYNDGPSWWVFGATVLFSVSAGTINTNNIAVANIQITDKDPNSPSGATLQFYNQGKADVTDTTVGEGIQVVTLARFRNANSGTAAVYFAFHDTGVGVTKKYRAGSRFWGFRVGGA